MFDLIILLSSSLWLGILTSISPCPLATNIAAISFISKDIKNKKKTILAGFFYTLGRSFAYIIITLILVFSLSNVTSLSYFLQAYFNKILGFVLIITGMFLLEILSINLNSSYINNLASKLRNKNRAYSSFLLGALFALAFCPVSAALFFGAFIPLVIASKFSFIGSLSYGIGTSIPVILFAFILLYSLKSIDAVFNKITKIEFYLRYTTGFIFILVGIYYVLVYVFKLL